MARIVVAGGMPVEALFRYVISASVGKCVATKAGSILSGIEPRWS